MLQELAKPFYYDRAGEEAPGQKPYWTSPVLRFHKVLAGPGATGGVLAAASQWRVEGAEGVSEGAHAHLLHTSGITTQADTKLDTQNTQPAACCRALRYAAMWP